MFSRRRLFEISGSKSADRHLEFGIYQSADDKVTKTAEEWYNTVNEINTSYSDGSYHIPSFAEWNMLSNFHKAELKTFLGSCSITNNGVSCFCCSSWNTVRNLPYYRIYVDSGSMEDHTGNKTGCYCLLMKWSE